MKVENEKELKILHGDFTHFKQGIYSSKLIQCKHSENQTIVVCIPHSNINCSRGVQINFSVRFKIIIIKKYLMFIVLKPGFNSMKFLQVKLASVAIVYNL